MAGDPKDLKSGAGKEPKPVKIQLDLERPQKVGGFYQIFCSAIVSQGEKALSGQDIQFFLGGLPSGAVAQTDDNGRVPITISNIPLDTRTASIEAQMVGTAHRARQIIAMPEPEDRKKSVGTPAELIVDPTRIGNKITIFSRVVDEEGRGVSRTKLTVVDGVNARTEATDEDGEYQLSFELQPHEEREIAIYVAGHGDDGHRQTFRWRRI